VAAFDDLLPQVQQQLAVLLDGDRGVVDPAHHWDGLEASLEVGPD
jgi:hypothetical protein